MIMTRQPRILLVDDDPEVMGALRRVIRVFEPDWVVLTAEDGKAALDRLEEESFDLVVTDLNMPRVDGFQLLRRLERSYPETVRVVHSSHTAMLGTDPSRCLAHHILPKPAPVPDILAVLREAVLSAGFVTRAADPEPKLASVE
jgi:CheY-like chemotaxis protein